MQLAVNFGCSWSVFIAFNLETAISSRSPPSWSLHPTEVRSNRRSPSLELNSPLVLDRYSFVLEYNFLYSEPTRSVLEYELSALFQYITTSGHLNTYVVQGGARGFHDIAVNLIIYHSALPQRSTPVTQSSNDGNRKEVLRALFPKIRDIFSLFKYPDSTNWSSPLEASELIVFHLGLSLKEVFELYAMLISNPF